MRTNYPFKSAKSELIYIILNASLQKLNQIDGIMQIFQDNEYYTRYPTQIYRNIFTL